MIRLGLASLALCSLVACGRAQGVADQDLGGLVVETKAPDQPIDLAAAAKDSAELGRALARPYRAVIAALPAHTVTIAMTTTIEEAGRATDNLDEATRIELGEKAAFHATYTNTADYGREVTFVGNTLYLRPRYQRWHARAPETADEPAAQRDRFFAPIAATWDLLAPGAELTDQGAAQVAGRAGKKIAVRLAPTPAKPAPEALAQRKWREARAIEALTGEVILDAEKAVPLAVKLAGTVGFTRDGRRFKMKISLTAELSAFGTPVAITAPAETEVVATPERLREVDDRDYLLQGIAPPLRKNPDGTATAPVLPPPGAGSGSAAPASPGAGSGSAAEPDKPKKKKRKKRDDDAPSDGPKADAPKADAPEAKP